MITENLTNPGQEPVDNDEIKITYPSGATEIKRYWTPIEIIEDVPVVPPVVEMRQARRAVLAAGLTAAVEAAIEALPEPDRSVAKIEWEFAPTVKRHHGFVEMLAPALGLTDEQLDALFVAAAGY